MTVQPPQTFSASAQAGPNVFAANAVERRSLNGTEYLVAPAVLVREKVLNGGFLPAEEIEASVNAWNGAPITLDHPHKGGTPVPANRRDVYDSGRIIGRVFDASFNADENALTGDAWVDIAATKALGELGELVITALEQYENGGPAQNADGEDETPILDVSVGYWHNSREESGSFDGESYDQVAVNPRPDHLALLPHVPGRCSVEDGCGVPRESVAETVEPAFRPPKASANAVGEYDGMTQDNNGDDGPTAPQFPDDPEERGRIAQTLETLASWVHPRHDENGESFATDGGEDCGDECSCDDCSHESNGDEGGFAQNAREGDRVRWDSDAGTDNEPADVRYGIVVDNLPDDDENVRLVAAYEIVGGEWESAGTNVRITDDSLEVIDQLPPTSGIETQADSNSDMTVNIEDLAEQTAFSAEQIREMGDEEQNALVETVDGFDTDDDGDEDGDGGGDDTPDDTQDDTDDSPDDTPDDADAGAVDLLRSAFDEEPDETRSVLEDAGFVTRDDPAVAEVTANRQEKRDGWIDTISANTDKSEDELKSLDDDVLESWASSVGVAAQSGGRTGVNYAGQGGPRPESESSGDDSSHRPTGTITGNGGDD